jgi:hypothetical protein
MYTYQVSNVRAQSSELIALQH